jgi:hypothetical protein
MALALCGILVLAPPCAEAKRRGKSPAWSTVATRSHVGVIDSGVLQRVSYAMPDGKRLTIAHVHEEFALADDPVRASYDRLVAEQQSLNLRGNPYRVGSETFLAQAIGLPRYANDDAVRLAIRSGELQAIAENGLWRRHAAVPMLRFALAPEARRYLDDLEQRVIDKTGGGQGHFATISSAVRTVAKQGRMRVSPARCIEDGPCSTHTSGYAFDVSLLDRGLPRVTFDVLYKELLADRAKGRIAMIVEVHLNHFHVFVIPEGARPHVARRP